jgi:hypothetical protein
LFLLPSPTLFGYETFPIVGAEENIIRREKKKGFLSKGVITEDPRIYTYGGGDESERKRNYDGPSVHIPVGRRPIFCI